MSWFIPRNPNHLAAEDQQGGTAGRQESKNENGPTRDLDLARSTQWCRQAVPQSAHRDSLLKDDDTADGYDPSYDASHER